MNDTQQTVRTFLKEHGRLTLGVNEKGNYPNLSVMHYVVDSSMRMYVGTRTSFAKYAALKNDPRVTFVISDDTPQPLFVLSGHGMVRQIDAETVPLAYSFFKSENNATWYVEGADDFVMFEIEIASLRWLDVSSGTLQSTMVDITHLNTTEAAAAN